MSGPEILVCPFPHELYCMFGLFAPTCPLAADLKLWVEQRMNWLAEVFGIERLRQSPAVVPSAEWFPEPFNGSVEDVAAMFRRTCELMQLDPTRFHWLDPARASERIVFKQQSAIDPLGIRHERAPVLTSADVPWQQIEDPMMLVATIARAVTRAVLLGEHHLTRRVEDHLRVADLATVFFGMGVFAANTVIQERAVTSSGWHIWEVSSRGHLKEIEFAYALALFAWVRGEHKPAWANHLRPNVREPLRQSLRYLIKTNDSWFAPGRQTPVGREHEGRHETELLSDLRSRSPGVRLAAVRELSRRDVKTADVLAAIKPLLHDGEFSVRREAGSLLGRFGKDAEDAVPDLVDMAADPEPQARSLALRTLGEIGAAAVGFVPQIASLLEDEATEVRIQAALTLGDFGDSASEAVPQLSRLLHGLREDAVIGPAYALGQIGLQALSAVGNLMQIIYQGEGAARVAATQSLAGVGHKSETVLAALHWATADDDHEVRYAALEALADLEPLYDDSLPFLTRAAQSNDVGTRQRAALALSKVDGQIGAAVQCLANSMFPPLSPSSGEHDEFDEQSYAFVSAALREMGKRAVPPLLDSLTTPEGASRMFAAWALGRIGGAAKVTAESLPTLLHAQDPALVLLAAIACWNVDANKAGVVDALVNVLRSCDLSRDIPSEFDLCEVGPGGGGVSCEFLGQLKSPELLHRAVIRLALREIGQPAVETLAALLRTENAELCRELALTLAAVDYTIGGDVLNREAAKLDHDLNARKWLSAARQRRDELERLRRRYELATRNLDELASARRPTRQGTATGEICEAAWLLIAGLNALTNASPSPRPH